MLLFVVLCLGACAAVPTKDRHYAAADSFRPRFPDLRKDSSDGEFVVLKMPLEPSPGQEDPKAAQGERFDDILQVKGGKGSYPTDKIVTDVLSAQTELVRDVIEKPAVEKTIIVTEWDEPIQKTYIEESLEPASEEKPYGVPANPEFVLLPQYEPETSAEEDGADPDDERPIEEMPSSPVQPEETGVAELLPKKGVDSVSTTVEGDSAEPAVYPQHPIDGFKIPIEDTTSAKADQDSAESELEPVVYPQIPPGGQKFPVEDLASTKAEPKPEEMGLDPAVYPQNPADNHEILIEESGSSKAEEMPADTGLEPAVYPQNPVDDHKVAVDDSTSTKTVQGPEEMGLEPAVYPQNPVDDQKVPSEDPYLTKSEPKPAETEVQPATYPQITVDDDKVTVEDSTSIKAEETPAETGKEPEPAVYPQHPVDGHKVPVEIVPLGPDEKTKEKEEGTFESPTVEDIPKVEYVVPEQPIPDNTEVKPEPIDPPTDEDKPELPQKPLTPISPDFVDKVPETAEGSPLTPPEEPLHPAKNPTTIDEVCQDMHFTKFLFLIKKAGYRDMLTRKRPLTVLVPSDEAWNRLPLPVLNRLNRDRRFLRRVLRYHMMDDAFFNSGQPNYYCPSMLQGSPLFVSMRGKDMYVNGLLARPAPTQPEGGRHRVYVLSRVILPPFSDSLAQAIQTTGTFTRLYTLAIEAGLLDTELSENGPYTLFAPTDEAFSKLPPKTLEWLSWDKEALRELLRNHLVYGAHYTQSTDSVLKTLEGKDLEFGHQKGGVLVNGADLLTHDWTTSNGVLHAVDEVLFANELKPKPFVRPFLKRVHL